jgi:protein tyrosine/serine phosphatase
MVRPLRTLVGIAIVLALIAGPIGYAFHTQTQLRNFRVVCPGVLYRCGQPSLPALKRLIHDYGIRTVVTLRDSYEAGKPPPDLAEEEYCKREGLLHVRISPRNWWGPDGVPPVDEGVRTFLHVMSDPNNHPVLVHCFAGIHRTGAYCAIYRMEFEGWSNERAIEEMKSCGYFNLDEELDILGYLERYQPGKLSGPAPDPAPAPVKKKKPAKKKSEG